MNPFFFRNLVADMLELPGTYSDLALPGLSGATVLITGGSRGTGRVTSHLFAKCGSRVAVNARSKEDAEGVANELIQAYGVEAIGLAADVSEVQAVEKMFAEFSLWSERQLQVLVCNAGHPLVDELWHTPLHEMSSSEVVQWFQRVRAVDLDGARYCSRMALQLMVPQRKGCLIYISSTPALSGYYGTPYTEAKAGLLGLMRDLALEYGKHNIRANAVALGNIASGWYEKLNQERKDELSHEAPLGRWGTSGEVAGAILFLASDLAGFITGQTIVIDGGKVMR